MSRMVERGEIPSGAPVLLLGFGSGLAYAAPGRARALTRPCSHVPTTRRTDHPTERNQSRGQLPRRSAPDSPASSKRSPTSSPGDVTDEKSFIDDLDVDSLSMVEVAMAAEEKFGVKIPDDELPKLKTVGDAVTYIESNA